MKLQCALDTCSKKEYFEIINEISDITDILEIGTPIALRYGADLIIETREKYPSLTIVADFKICDGGEYEADMAFNAGADIVTVMGFSNNETIKGVIRSAKKHEKKCTVDMMCVDDVEGRTKEMMQLGTNYVCLHNATDALDFEDSFARIKRAASVIDTKHLAVAGGISLQSIGKLKVFNPEIIIVGNYLYKSVNRRETIKKLKEEYYSASI